MDLVEKLIHSDGNIPVQNELITSLKEINAKSLNDKQLREKINSAWNNNTENVDIDLLKSQLLGFNLLSHDIDLPIELDLEYVKPDYNVSNESLPPLLPLDDYNTKAEMLGIQPSRPKVSKEFHSVGLPELEESIKLQIEERIANLQQIPSNIGSLDFTKFENDLRFSNDQIIDGIDSLKIDALVELKSLKLLPLQKQIRNHLLIKVATNTIYNDENLNNYSIFKTWKRTYCVHPKQKILQTAKLAEKLLQQQQIEKERQQQLVHESLVKHLTDLSVENQNNVSARHLHKIHLARSIHQFHQQTEREQSKKFERNAKQRLQALKANDEEAYIRLLDQTKDKRITHLLKQTNSFLDSLANAVKDQQNQSKSHSKDKKIIEEDDEDDNTEKKKVDYYDVAHKIKESVTKQPSLLVGGTLKEYQIKGLEWMVSLYNNHLNGILADEMGLGKTIQSIALITYLIEMKHEMGKFLIIVPLSTITNWTLEFEQWAPSLKTIVYKGTQNQRKELQHQIRMGDFNVLLTTYEYVIKDRPLLCKFKWAHMLIDEGHRLKNANSKLFQTLTNYYHTNNRLILTGTPLQNSLPELWALLNFILPKVFNSVKSFDEWFNTPFANTGHQEKLELSEEESLLIIRRLHKVLRPFLLRRLKKDVAKDLPDKVEKVIKCKFSALQLRIYKQLLNHNALFIGEGSIGATKSGLKGLNNKIMQLRKACNHPFVFEEVENIVNPERLTTNLIWRCSGKFEVLDRILPKLKNTGHRVLIFFQMTQVMDIMEDYLRFKNLKYMRLDGSTKAEDRQNMLKDFNEPNSEYFCFLLSTRAGGLGLNLQTADTVIIFDTDWNPHQDLQAQDRAHRIGQKNEVRILRLITSESFEEVILERAHQKLDIDGKVIQAGKFDNKSSAEEQEAYLKQLIEAENSKNDDEEVDNYDDNEINEILARNENEIEIFEDLDMQRVLEDKEMGIKNRLMNDDEVPQVFKEDMNDHLNNNKEDNVSGRRIKKKVVYDDGLTEEQWLQAMDNDDDSVEAAIERKRIRMAKMRKNKGLGDDDEEEEDLVLDDDSDEEVYENELPTRKRSRSNTPKSSTPSAPAKKVKPPTPEWVIKSNDLLTQMENVVDEDGNDASNVFMKLPSRKFFADYFKIIKNPVSLGQLRKNIDGKKIRSFEEVVEGLKQMFLNARYYNEEGSWVIKCADLLEKRMNEFLNEGEETKEGEEVEEAEE